MAIAFDAAAAGTSAGSPLTWTHTVGSNTNGIVWVGVWMGTVDNVTATYDGVAMTQAVKQRNSVDSIWHYLFYLVNPPTGAKTVSVAGTVSYGVTRGASASYTGAAQTGIPDVTGSAETSGATTLGVPVTTTVADAWLVCWGRKSTTDTGQTFSGATAERQVTGNGTSLGDSNGSVGVAGSYTSTFNTNSGSEPLAQVVAAFGPAAAGAAGNPWYAYAQQRGRIELDKVLGSFRLPPTPVTVH